jgi:hypothetical protein
VLVSLEIKQKLYKTIYGLSEKYNKKITKKMGIYRKYWDKMVDVLSEDVVIDLLEKEIVKVKGFRKKQFGRVFGKKPLNQMRKGIVKSKGFSKWKGLKVSR